MPIEAANQDADRVGVDQVVLVLWPLHRFGVLDPDQRALTALGVRSEQGQLEQLTRDLELMNRDPQLAPVRGIFAGQQIKPQARTLASDRGIEWRLIDYDALRGLDNADERLF